MVCRELQKRYSAGSIASVALPSSTVTFSRCAQIQDKIVVEILKEIHTQKGNQQKSALRVRDIVYDEAERGGTDGQ